MKLVAKNLLMVALVSLFVVACGDDEESNNATNNSNNTANNVNNANNTNNATNNANNTNNATNNANNTNNATNNANNTNNATNNDNNTEPSYEEPFITQFEFRQKVEGIVNFVGNDVNTRERTIGNLQGRTVQIDDDQDWAEWETTVVENAALIENMQNGFECPPIDTSSDMGMTEAPVYEFEARIQEAGFENKIQDISGCVVAETENVQPIVELIDRLAMKYLP